VVYVKPTKAKVRSNTFSNNSSIWISLLSLATTLASLIVVIVK
jgi:polysaccharide export outer membrane protein